LPGVRFDGPRIKSTATLIATRARSVSAETFGDIVDNRQSIAGEWTPLGGTGADRRLRGRGHCNGVADYVAAPPACCRPPCAARS
jgi:hypothetical protein